MWVPGGTRVLLRGGGGAGPKGTTNVRGTASTPIRPRAKMHKNGVSGQGGVFGLFPHNVGLRVGSNQSKGHFFLIQIFEN